MGDNEAQVHFGVAAMELVPLFAGKRPENDVLGALIRGRKAGNRFPQAF